MPHYAKLPPMTKAEMDKLDKERANIARNKGILPPMTQQTMNRLDEERGTRGFLSKAVHGVLPGAESIAGGALNPFINVANLAPEAANKLTELATGKTYRPWNIPHIPIPDPLVGDVANIASYGVGAGELAKAVNLATEGVKGLSAASRFAPAVNLGKAVGTNVGAAAAMSPTGSRLEGAEYGGAFGAGGHIIGGALPSVGRIITKAGIPEAASRYLGKFSENLPFRSDDEVNQEMIHNIGQNYVNARNESAPFYHSVFEGNGKKMMSPAALTNYQKALNNMAQVNADDFVKPEGFATAENDKINPKDIHFYQSDLGDQIRNMTSKGETKGVQPVIIAQKGLQSDLAAHLKKTGKLTDYEKAQQLYAEHTAPFSSKLASGAKSPMKAMKAALNITRNDDGTQELSSNPLKSGSAYRDVVPDFIERISDNPLKSDNLNRLNYLADRLGGDRDKAIEYTKHNLFSSSFNPATGRIDAPKFLKAYDKLSDLQKSALFNAPQQEGIQKLALANGIVKDTRDPKMIKAINHLGRMGIGLASALHFGHGLRSEALYGAAGYGAAPLARGATQKIAHAFLPSTQQELGQYLERADAPRPAPHPFYNPANIAAGAGIASSPVGFGNGN